VLILFFTDHTPCSVQAWPVTTTWPRHRTSSPNLSANNSTILQQPPPRLRLTGCSQIKSSGPFLVHAISSRSYGTTTTTTTTTTKCPSLPPYLVLLSQKYSQRVHSRHPSLDDTKTPAQLVPPTPAPPVSKVMLVAKVKLDDAFIDFRAYSLLDPISKLWSCCILC